MTSSSTAVPQGTRSGFVSTRWTVVLSAGDPSSPRAATALEALCRAYWYPLYAYVRRRGYSVEDAQDLTQAFFGHLLEARSISTADRDKGRFRGFLLARLNHFLADDWDRRIAQKRGGGQRLVPLEAETAETRYHREPADLRSPDKLFEHRWAVTLLERVFEQLRQEYTAKGKATLFDELKDCLVQTRTAGAQDGTAVRLGLSEGALRVAVHRLRQRYRRLLRLEVADTVSGPEEVEEELRHLFQVLTG